MKIIRSKHLIEYKKKTHKELFVLTITINNTLFSITPILARPLNILLVP